MKKINYFITATVGTVITVMYSPQTLAQQGWNLGGNSVGKDTTLGTVNNFALKFITNNQERMRINSAGNIGIGINNPAVRLHVQNTGAQEVARFVGPNSMRLSFYEQN